MIQVKSELKGNEIIFVKERTVKNGNDKVVTYIVKDVVNEKFKHTVILRHFVKADSKQPIFKKGDVVVFKGHLEENRWKDQTTDKWVSTGQQVEVEEIEKA